MKDLPSTANPANAESIAPQVETGESWKHKIRRVSEISYALTGPLCASLLQMSPGIACRSLIRPATGRTLHHFLQEPAPDPLMET